MLEPLISGITFGLILAIMLGPVFFALLQTSLHEGFKAGTHFAIGVFLSDTLIAITCLFFAAQLDLLNGKKMYMGVAGGVILISFGVFNFFKKIKVKEVDDDRKTVHAKFMAHGFLLNIFNPAVLLFWIGIIGLVGVRENYTTMHITLFFSGILLTVLATDLGKALIAHRVKDLLKATVIEWINRLTGVALIGFGIHMILKSI